MIAQSCHGCGMWDSPNYLYLPKTDGSGEEALLCIKGIELFCEIDNLLGGKPNATPS